MASFDAAADEQTVYADRQCVEQTAFVVAEGEYRVLCRRLQPRRGAAHVLCERSVVRRFPIARRREQRRDCAQQTLHQRFGGIVKALVEKCADRILVQRAGRQRQCENDDQ